MTILQSGRIVHLNNSGEVIWEEWPDPSDEIMAHSAQVHIAEWTRRSQQSKSKNVPIMASTATQQPEPVTPFGYDLSHVHYGKRYKRFSIKN